MDKEFKVSHNRTNAPISEKNILNLSIPKYLPSFPFFTSKLQLKFRQYNYFIS